MAESTTNYKQFKVLAGNRQINKLHLQRLTKSIAKKNLLALKPIKVNDQMEVVDGQHRLAAATNLNVPIYFEKVGDVGLDETIILNTGQMNWGIAEFATSYAAKGNENYQTFLDFMESYKTVPLHIIAMILSGSTGGSASQVFKRGEFKVVDAAQAETYLDMLGDVAQYMPARFTKSNVAALLQVFHNAEYDHDRMLKQLANYGTGKITGYGKVNDVLRELEAVYNFHQPKSVRFF